MGRLYAKERRKSKLESAVMSRRLATWSVVAGRPPRRTEEEEPRPPGKPLQSCHVRSSETRRENTSHDGPRDREGQNQSTQQRHSSGSLRLALRISNRFRLTISTMRRIVVLALIVAELVFLATVHFSKGEPLPAPSSV